MSLVVIVTIILKPKVYIYLNKFRSIIFGDTNPNEVETIIKIIETRKFCSRIIP